MFSRLRTGLISALFILISFSLLAADVKPKTKVAIKTKQGKAVVTKNGEPVCFKPKTKK